MAIEIGVRIGTVVDNPSLYGIVIAADASVKVVQLVMEREDCNVERLGGPTFFLEARRGTTRGWNGGDKGRLDFAILRGAES